MQRNTVMHQCAEWKHSHVHLAASDYNVYCDFRKINTTVRILEG